MSIEQLPMKRGIANASLFNQQTADNVVHLDETPCWIERQRERQTVQSVTQVLRVELIEATGPFPQPFERADRDRNVFREHGQLRKPLSFIRAQTLGAQFERFPYGMRAGDGIAGVEKSQASFVEGAV